MASSSKEFQNTNKKVIVVKSNDFFTVKKIPQRPNENLEDLTSLASNDTIIPKVYKDSKPSSSQSLTTGSQQSLVKQGVQKQVEPNKIVRIQTLPCRTYKGKVPVIQNGAETTRLVNFTNLSRASNVTEHVVVKSSEKATTSTYKDLDKNVAVGVTCRKKGDALQPHLKLPTEQVQTIRNISTNSNVTILQDPISKLSTDIYEYKQKEEQFLNQIDERQLLESAKNYLESILISESPDNETTLFTKEELKKLPDKIFESPKQHYVKQENFSVKTEELIDKTNTDVVNYDLETKTPGHVKADSSCYSKIPIKITKLNVDQNVPRENLFNEPNQIKPEQHFQEESIPTELGNSIDEIHISNEDASILKEMDEFIVEIEEQNKSFSLGELNEPVTSSSDGTKERKTVFNYYLEDIQNDLMIMAKFEERNDSVEQSDIRIDAQKTSLEPDNTKTNTISEQKDTLKEDILAKAVSCAEIDKYMKKCNFTETALDISTTTADKGYKTAEVETKTVTNSTADQKTNLDQCELFVVNENGILEPICSDEKDSNFSKEHEPILQENNSTNNSIVKTEILTLLDKAKSFQYTSSDDFRDGSKIEYEQIKLLQTSLKEHVKLLNDLYEKLNYITVENTEEVDDISTLFNNLNFVKNILQKIFTKEEKKQVKYKVISITNKTSSQSNVQSTENKKNNFITKKLYSKRTAPKVNSNKLLQKAMLRMKKLLDALEKNRALLLMNAGTPLKKVAKSNLKNKKKFGAFKSTEAKDVSDTEGFNCYDSLQNVETEKTADLNKHSLETDKPPILQRMDQATENKSFIKSIASEFDESKQNITLGNENLDDSKHKIKVRKESKLKYLDFKSEEENTSRYFLRPRKSLSYSEDSGGQVKNDKAKNELDYSNRIPLTPRNHNLGLEYDKIPCMIMYNKPKASIACKIPKEQYPVTKIKKESAAYGTPHRYETRNRVAKKGTST